ncbi:MAG: cation diffusion facilitator family transporter [Deltaproteobacteria bacterium]|nr:cation diffusion facilitator family transporter [Deltaproteobacteria bacterium]
MKSESKRAVVAALLANLGIAVAKLVGFAFTGAASMLAEAIHSIADTANQGLLFVGGALARRQATASHPFGYGRERYFWAFIVSLVIFTLGSLFALYEGVTKLVHPHALHSPAWAIGILVVAMALESASFTVAIRQSNKLRAGESWWAFVRRSKVPELPVVLLEDLGALVGLALALLGVGLTVATGNARYDALGSMAIGVLLFAIAAVLAVEMRSLLLGEAAAPVTERALRQVIEADAEVRRLVHMRTQHLGPEELLVAIKVELDAGLDFAGVVGAINRVEAALRAACPIARVIYVEPDYCAGADEPNERA